jgi:hypothetical protein
MVLSVIVAAGAVTLCALVAIAWMFGWLPTRATVTAPPGVASPGPQAAPPGVALLPGETVVTPETSPAPLPAAPGPALPNYTRTAPVPRDPAPEPAARAPAPRAPSLATAPRAPSSAPAPKTPTYARIEPQRNLCGNCATVTSTTAYPDGWEVRVRFEDGATQTHRYRNPPNLRIGQRVRLEDGRLLRDD